ncbi:MAG: guanine deaminase [Desulfobulbus sp.]|nr:MAG: guanine deaminase [Desulfobulbus sp.]
MNTGGLAIRGRFLDLKETVKHAGDLKEQIRFMDDGLLLVNNGRIEWFGRWQERKDRIPASYAFHDHRDQPVFSHRPKQQGRAVDTAANDPAAFYGKLIVPGFVDTHIHFPQAEIIGSYGEQLLDWLDNYAFPAEQQYNDAAYAGEMAEFFIDQLLQNGTTTAMVFATVHPQSVEAVFQAAEKKRMRLISGKVLMDRNAPQPLLDTAETGYRQSRELIEKYHGRGRLLYAVTPRFALTSTPEQLELAGRLKKEFPETYLQTHLSENRAEIDKVKQLFPGCANYLEVYDRYGLTGARSVFAHCIHLEEAEWDCLARTGSSIAFCPTSNLFLGSGLFDLERARSKHIAVGMASDIGGGTSFNMLETLEEAYKVTQLQKQQFSPWEALYRATLGGAQALSLEDRIGNFTPGKEADFIVLDPGATPLQTMRCQRAENIQELLFNLIILGYDRSITHTYVDGRLVYEQESLN